MFTALEQAETIGEVKKVLDIAEAAREYAHRAQLGIEQENRAAELSLRAQRKAGQILADLPRPAAGRPRKIVPSVGQFSRYREILAENAIARTTAYRWEELGRLLDDEFETRIARIIADGQSPAAVRFVRLDNEDRRERLRARNRELVLGVQPPEGPASTIVIDPPWDWGDEGDVDQFGRARPTYKTIPLDELAEFPVPTLADPDAHLYLWITNRSLPKGFGLLEQWGFRYVTCLTWVKPSIGMGNYYRGQTEHVLFGVRGSLPLLRQDVGTALAAPRPAGHSTKPDEFYELIETCSPGPWMDIFARRERPGWITWGAEV
jgi:N6-adenosine-specific RNA methylase IME4